jgi:hypothetical protein
MADTVFKTGDDVVLHYTERTVIPRQGLGSEQRSQRIVEVPAHVLLASPNGASLLLTFDAVIGKHAGSMPVLLGRDGQFRSIITDEIVHLHAPGSPGRTA